MTFMHTLAEMCMPALYFIESIRNSFFDSFFALVTHIGEETFFLALAITFFWCINKRHGYFIFITGLVGTMLNQILKLIFRVPRPWIIDPEYKIIESAREKAAGYSFPSGHTQNIAGTFGAIAAHQPKKWKTVLCVVIIGLVAFSRFYLGVHSPIDIIASLILALGLILLLRPVFLSDERMHKLMPVVISASLLISIGFLVYVLSISGDTTLDPYNFKSGLKNACTMLGCTLGLVLIYFLDRKYINFQTEAVWYAQIIKLVLGLCGVLVIKSGLSAPLTAIFGNEYVARVVRYFLIVAFAGSLWPLTFKWFGSLRIGFMDKFTDWVKTKFSKRKA